jgi:hypothetical protein
LAKLSCLDSPSKEKKKTILLVFQTIYHQTSWLYGNVVASKFSNLGFNFMYPMDLSWVSKPLQQKNKTSKSQKSNSAAVW